jgi:hypothetical protein
VDNRSGRGRPLPGIAVDTLAEEVGAAVAAGALLDHVEAGPAEEASPP